MIGIFDSNILLTIVSSLKHHKSSILPPPRAIIMTSGLFKLFFLLKYLIDSRICSTALSPWTAIGYNSTRLGNLSKIIRSISSITEPEEEVDSENKENNQEENMTNE